MVSAGFNQVWRSMIWAEAANMATKLENLLVTPRKKTSAFSEFHGGKSISPIKNLHKFGEMCVAKDQTVHKAKIGDRGILCFFVGYADNHSGSTFRLLNANTHRPILSRDVTFLKKSYGDWTKEDVKKITDKNLVEEEEEF